MEESISLAALPFPRSLKLTNYLDAAGKISQDKLYVCSGTFLPSLSRLIVSEASKQALTRLAIIALAVESSRVAKADWNTLKQLTHRVSRRRSNGSFRRSPSPIPPLRSRIDLQCYGADGHDDGGRESPETKKITDKTTYDLTFVVER